MTKLISAPIAFKDAAAFVVEHHRHHTPPVGHKFSISAVAGGEVVGVVIVGRPVAPARRQAPAGTEVAVRKDGGMSDDENVHHIDGDKTNNQENNLALETRSGHARLHRREERLAKGAM